MEKRRRGKRALAVVMSFIMSITLLFTNGTMVKAEGNTTDQKSIVFTMRQSNNVTGNIYYQSGGNWVEITNWDANGSYTLSLDASVTSVVIRAVPSEGGYINRSNSTIGDRNIDNQDAQNLKSETGHTVNFDDATSINVDIEFDNNPGQTQTPDDPKQYDANTFNFNVTNNLGNGGDVYVKLYNGNTDITSKFAIENQLVDEVNGPDGFLHVICQGEMVNDEWCFTDMSSVPLVVTDGENQVKATKIQILICLKADEQSTFSLSDEVRISKNGNGDGDPGYVRINNNTEEGADNSAYDAFLKDGYLYNLSTAEEDADAFYEMEFAFVNPEQPNQPDQPNPPSPGISDDFSVMIGSDTVYKAAVGEEEQNITVPKGAAYDVELIKDQGDTIGIAIKPNQGTDKLGPNADISEKQSLTLEPIVVTGNGRVEVHAGLNYTPEGAEFHEEEDVPVVIKASDTTGYSFEANGDVDFLICQGNFRSTATLEGGVKARSFTLNDMAQLTIGSEQKPVNEAFCAPLKENDGIYESSSVEFNLAKVAIYAINGFTNYNELRAWDEADVNVTLFGESAQMFDNVKCMRVQTGGKFTLNSNSQITYPDGFKVQAGYYNEIGEILDIPADGRFQEKVNIVDCTVGDHSKNEGEGRYIYSIHNNNTEITLESTSKTLWSLGYSFLPDSGDQYVKNGHFKINAGSGLERDGMTEGGEYLFEAGTEVTFKLVPDTGYRYKEGTFKFNGDASDSVVKPTETPGVYIFTMPSNPIHVSCEFEEAKDEIGVEDSDAVNAADIDVPDGAINGVAKFNVADKDLAPEEEDKFANAAKDMVLETALDLSMNEVIDKIGTKNDSWVTPVTELVVPMTVTLDLESSLGGYEDYKVVRQHGDEITPLDTQYNAETNSITFETDKYSTYVIAHSEKKAHVHTPIVKNVKEPTCKDTGYTGDTYCEECGEKIATGKTVPKTENHKWDEGKITKEATATENGVKTYTCTVCGTTKTEPISATGVPEKGTEIKDEKGTASYEVTGSDEKNPTATYTGTTSSTAKTIIIPSTVTVEGITYKVTSIADDAFKGNNTITKVTIPKNVTTIGANAFNGCTKLSTVTLGSSVTSIGANAFKNCKVLAKVTIPSKVTTIGSNAFNGCTKLKKVTVGSNVTSVGTNAFKGCKTLTKITLPGKTNKIGANAFNGCSKLKTITIKSKKMTSSTISKNAFKGISSKATIKVPKGKAKTYKTLFQKKGLSKKVKVQ